MFVVTHKKKTVHHTGDFRAQAINLLRPSGFYTYHPVKHSKLVHGGHFVLSVLYGSQNRQRLLLHTALTDWFL